MSDLDCFLILNLQEGFTGVAMLEVQRGLDQDENKNFEIRGEYMKAGARTFIE